MNDVRLGTLQLEGFRSFRSKQKIAFPNRGLVMIRGRSGHGKSNLALGIAYALGYAQKPATELMTWDWDRKWGASLLFFKDHTHVEVERGSKFTLRVDAESITGSAASKGQKLTETLGLEPDLLAPLTYRPQRSFGLFLSMPDEDKKEFLGKLLALDRFEQAGEEAGKRISELERVLQTYEIDRQAAEHGIALLESQQQVIEDEKQAQDSVAVLRQFVTEQPDLDQLQAKIRDYIIETNTLASTAHSAATEQVVKLERQFERARLARAALPDVETTAEETRLIGLIAKAGAVLKKLQADDRERQNAISYERDQWGMKLAQEQFAIDGEPRVREELAKVEHQLQHLTTTHQCPTCQQDWAGGAEKDKLVASVRMKVAHWEAELRFLDTRRAAVREIEGKLASLVFEPNPKVEQMLQAKSQAEQKLAAEQARASSALREMQANYAADDSQWRALVADAKTAAARARNAVVERREPLQNELEYAVVPLVQNLEVGKRRLAEAEARLSAIQERNRTRQQIETQRLTQLEQRRTALTNVARKIEEAQRELAQERDFAVLVGRDGYLGTIFEEVLAEIAHETNEVLVRVPNVQEVTLQFKTRVEAKTTGKAKSRITPVVYIGGKERSFGDLSGGQTSAVELAVDIAIRRVVSRRRGVHIGWMVLDEAFDGLGRADKECVMEVLQYAAQQDLILVVDHATEFRDMFTQFIDVELIDGESRVA